MTDTTTTSTTTVQSIISFFAELIGRLFSKTPAFFKVIQVISVIVAIVTGLPAMLAGIPGLVLPAFIVALESKVISIAGLVSLFISSLPVETPTTTTTK